MGQEMSRENKKQNEIPVERNGAPGTDHYEVLLAVGSAAGCPVSVYCLVVG